MSAFFFSPWVALLVFLTLSILACSWSAYWSWGTNSLNTDKPVGYRVKQPKHWCSGLWRYAAYPAGIWYPNDWSARLGAIGLAAEPKRVPARLFASHHQTRIGRLCLSYLAYPPVSKHDGRGNSLFRSLFEKGTDAASCPAWRFLGRYSQTEDG